MKSLKNFAYAIFVFAAFVLVSCDKDVETTALTVNTSLTATVKGYVYANLDLTDHSVEKAPAGTKVIISVPNSQLSYLTNGKGNYVDTVKLDANGEFEVKVPTDATDGVTVTIQPIDFIYAQKQAFNSNYQTINKYYTCNAQTVTAKAGEYKVKTMSYNDPTDFSDFSYFVTLSGTGYADLDLTSVGNEKAAAGTKITFYTTGWSKEVTLGTNGTYSVEVPANNTIYVSYNFNADKKIDATPTFKPYNYQGSLTLSSYSVNTKDINLSFGNGVEVVN